MTYNVHGYVDGKMLFNRRMDHLPRAGDTLRYGDPDTYATVTEVIWCMNEEWFAGLRVNLRMESKNE